MANGGNRKGILMNCPTVSWEGDPYIICVMGGVDGYFSCEVGESRVY